MLRVPQGGHVSGKGGGGGGCRPDQGVRTTPLGNNIRSRGEPNGGVGVLAYRERAKG